MVIDLVRVVLKTTNILKSRGKQQKYVFDSELDIQLVGFINFWLKPDLILVESLASPSELHYCAFIIAAFEHQLPALYQHLDLLELHFSCYIFSGAFGDWEDFLFNELGDEGRKVIELLAAHL